MMYSEQPNEKKPRRRKNAGFSQPTFYSESKTIPGQSLVPAELLKRHLAGTLPDIQHVPRYTHDEYGNQIDEDLSKLELHELAELADRAKLEVKRRQEEQHEKNSKDSRQRIIDEYLKEEREKQKTALLPDDNPGQGAPDQIPPPKGVVTGKDLKGAGTRPGRKGSETL